MQLFNLSFQSLKATLGATVLLSLIVGFLCISFIHAMPVHADVGGVHEVHSSQSSILNACCDTGASDHMELWKSTLVGIPQGFQDVLILIVLAVTAVFVLTDFFPVPRLNTNVLYFRYRQYNREHPDIGTFNILRLAFARGILHPKTY